ncbi:phosphotransferase system lactose/cellobiose-specific IIB subunit [Coriobacterium glomerans PW2]|uniref:Phosphotransferase system lactose/cellobiose-specific IIB subunit n=1 Tax=Coriobacterium glomerans (strain ATCC 49209 / DSM 20642 / JCM 10262 / PW2) TaxID=700015 RepID=F2N937_CORGP|nr:PTS lactose transporter subunit IIB [Coriobacterium glomerans]AEB07713.1 phosphotransferase system lactose/cellobiose-specific IIB subunit [Coriobacterium glomerans PW2]
MKKIVLMCAGGMSTSIIMKNIKRAAEEEGLECEVVARAIADAADAGRDADVILLGPQVGYAIDDVRASCPGVPVDVIEMIAYGMMDGKKALAQAKVAMGI